jgi:hypothetical protein
MVKRGGEKINQRALNAGKEKMMKRILSRMRIILLMPLLIIAWGCTHVTSPQPYSQGSSGRVVDCFKTPTEYTDQERRACTGGN